MRRLFLIVNILIAALAVSPFIDAPITIYIEEDYSIKNMPTSTVLAQLNIIPTVLHKSEKLEINTVNHQSRSITINGVLYDLDAVHYMLYQMIDLEETIDLYISENQSGPETKSLLQLKDYIAENSLQFKARFYEFIDQTNFMEEASLFIKSLFDDDQKELPFDFLSNKSVKPFEIKFYEDFDEEGMVAGIYGLYHIYDVEEFYVQSELCTDLDLSSSIDEEQKNTLIDNLTNEQFYEEENCLLSIYTMLEQTLTFEIIKETFYPHANSFTFDYQSHSEKPYARFRVVFDHFYEEKLLISSETMNFKITKEANDYRNDYNLELEEGVYTSSLRPVDIMYPHRSFIRGKRLWFYTKSNYFHQMTEEHQYNVKYRKDMIYYDAYNKSEALGGLELIFDEIGYVVYDPLVTFTFNYGIGDMEHYLKDVYPFLLWGTSKDNRESYSMAERFIWDKDRFSRYQYGHILDGNGLREYYDRKLKNVIIGTDIPFQILNDIERFYFMTR